MFRVLTKITFTQQPTKDIPSRNRTIVYEFCHEFDVTTTWDSLTDDGSITLPKNVYVKDKDGKKYSLGGIFENLGGFDNNKPIFLRGDKVKIEWGYAYYEKRGNEIAPFVIIYEGFISQVTSKKPFVLKIEDNMYVLKKVQASGGNNGFFSGKKYTVEKMIAEMIKNAASNKNLPTSITDVLKTFSVNTTTSTSLGDFISKNETVAEVLARLRKQFHFESYFRKNELRVGAFKYLPADALILPDGSTRTKFATFKFQYNIISDNLEYKRKDDITLSAVATNTIEVETGQYTKFGVPKTKKKRLEVLVTFENGNENARTTIATRDQPLPPSDGGERRTLHFMGANTTDELIKLATAELRKYYYTGLRGKFVTFGMPFVEVGNYINIIDPILPERNGRYLVRSVKYTGGVQGLRQEIELDYLLFRINEKGNQIQ